jgi:hypothetical protein
LGNGTYLTIYFIVIFEVNLKVRFIIFNFISTLIEIEKNNWTSKMFWSFLTEFTKNKINPEAKFAVRDS